jgi:hypothetical protein
LSANDRSGPVLGKGDPGRKLRLAAALRENLRRRKAPAGSEAAENRDEMATGGESPGGRPPEAVKTVLKP